MAVEPELDTFFATRTRAKPLKEAAPAPKAKQVSQNRSKNQETVYRTRKSPPGTKWEDRYQRATFHLPKDLLEDLDAYVSKHGWLSKAQIVREALEAWLKKHQR